VVSDGLNPYVLWLRNVLKNQGYRMPPVKVFQDNMSALRPFQTGKCLSSLRNRRTPIRFYFVKNLIDHGDIAVSSVGTNDMIADILTKIQ